MHMTDWAKTQREDPVLNTALDWLEVWKKADLETLLGEHASSVDGQQVWRNCQNFVIHQKSLYLCTTPKGEIEHLMLFVIPRVHQVTTLNGCHWDVGHQGHVHNLSLLQEHFWWPGMASQMQQAIRICTHCLQHEGSLPKALVHPIVTTAPLDLLYVDLTNIETTLELNQSPRVANVFVFQDHFMKHMLLYVTIYQTAKTFANFFLYQGYISVFGAPIRLMSDRGANLMSSVIEEMCKILGIKKLWTTPYHPQTNGLVERSHQMIIWMIRKLGEDKKAHWPSHLAKIAHAYSATHSPVKGYSPHYLMFRQRPRLPVNFYFPTIGSIEAPTREASTKHVDEFVASVWDRVRTALWKAQAQSMAEACWQKQYYNRKMDTVNLNPGDLVLVKADVFKGKRKIKDRWEEDTWEVVHQITTNIPSYKVMGPMQMVTHPLLRATSSHCIRGWHSLVYRCPSCTGQVYQPHPMQAHLLTRWNWDDDTREYWWCSHPMPCQHDFPVVD